MQDDTALRAIESKYRSLRVLMDERMRRQWAAAESRAYGWGGVREGLRGGLRILGWVGNAEVVVG